MKKMLCLVSAVAGLVLGASSSFAALTAEQLAVTGSVDTMITDMSAWGWTAILAIISFTVGAKVFKRILGSAT